MTRTEMLVKLDQSIQDDSDLLDNATRLAFLDEAVKVYSEDNPREVSESFAGNGAYDYALPTDWVEEFSTILAVEYPGGYQVPNYLDLSDVVLYDDGDGDARMLRFLYHTPSATETFIITHTAPHTLNDTTNTIPVPDQDAVVNLAAAYCCNALAMKLAQSAKGRDPNLETTVYLWRSVNRYREMARAFEGNYNRKVGGGTPAASSSHQIKTRPSWSGEISYGFFRDRSIS